MTKKVAFGAKPQPAKTIGANPDQWVTSKRESKGERMKRITFDVPASLHARIKSQCALRGVKMNEELRELVEKHFPADS
jgi:hypothetical protein